MRALTLSPDLRDFRTFAKLLDALLHSSASGALAPFCQASGLVWLGFLFDFLKTAESVQISDILRVSGVVLGLFEEFSGLSDGSMTKVLSEFVCAVYALAQERVFSKKEFSVRDKTLPIGFAGERAAFVYVGDQYEVRSMFDLHVLAAPGAFRVCALGGEVVPPWEPESAESAKDLKDAENAQNAQNAENAESKDAHSAGVERGVGSGVECGVECGVAP